MPEQPWNVMLRRIPPNFHEGLVFATVNGAELVTQAILQVEEDFVILRGRTAGTSDNGRMIILPFHQINYLAFNGKLTEPQMLAIIGNRETDFAVMPMLPAEADGSKLAELPESQDDEQASEEPAPRPSQPSKSILLAKLRARLANDSTK